MFDSVKNISRQNNRCTNFTGFLATLQNIKCLVTHSATMINKIRNFSVFRNVGLDVFVISSKVSSITMIADQNSLISSVVADMKVLTCSSSAIIL